MLLPLILLSSNQNGGRFIYALDDPYIHMAMARNLIQHGVWGITGHEFTSTSSSPLWTLAIAALFAVVGVQDTIPLLLNVVLASVLGAYVYVLVRRHLMSGLQRFGVLVAVFYLTPLAPVIFTGQEHILHILLSLVFLYAAAGILAREQPDLGAADAVRLSGVVAALSLTRYESLMMVLVFSGLCLLRGRWKLGLALTCAAWVPILAYGSISAEHGFFWLSSSVVLKAFLPPALVGSSSDANTVGTFITAAGYRIPTTLFEFAHFAALMIAAYTLYGVRAINKTAFWERDQVLLLLILGSALLHLVFGTFGAFYRYESYLMAVGIVGIALAWAALFGHASPRQVSPRIRRLVGAVLAVLTVPLLIRGTESVAYIPQATGNIYQQQYQLALFLREHYSGASVAIHDVGATSFLADIRILDLFGLASADVLRSRVEGRYDTAEIAALATSKGVSIAVLYDAWFHPTGSLRVERLPASWVAVGMWRIDNPVTVTSDTYTFYAVDPSAETTLVSNLQRFAANLPPTVIQGGKYVR